MAKMRPGPFPFLPLSLPDFVHKCIGSGGVWGYGSSHCLPEVPPLDFQVFVSLPGEVSFKMQVLLEGVMLQTDLRRCITRYFCLLNRGLVQGLFMAGSRRKEKSEQGAAVGDWKSAFRKDEGLTGRPCRGLTGWERGCYQMLQ